jgi:hypothetical protein
MLRAYSVPVNAGLGRTLVHCVFGSAPYRTTMTWRGSFSAMPISRFAAAIFLTLAASPRRDGVTPQSRASLPSLRIFLPQERARLHRCLRIPSRNALPQCVSIPPRSARQSSALAERLRPLAGCERSSKSEQFRSRKSEQSSVVEGPQDQFFARQRGAPLIVIACGKTAQMSTIIHNLPS